MTQKDWNALFNAIVNWSLVIVCTLALWAMGVDVHAALICTLWVVFHEQIAAFAQKWWGKLSSIRRRA